MITQSKTFPTIIYFSSMLAIGFAVASIGPSLGGMAERMQVGLEEISLLFLAKASGLVFSVIVAGKIFDLISKHLFLKVGLLILSVSMILVYQTTNLTGLILAVGLMGIGEGMLQVAVNTLTINLHKSHVISAMNYLHFTFGVGALGTPVLVGVLTETGDFSRVFLGGGCFIAVLLVVSFWLPEVSIMNTDSDKNKEVKRSNRILMALLTLGFFLYVGTDASYGGWVFQYSLKQGISDSIQAGWMTSLFWGAITAGRLVLIPVVKRFPPIHVMLGSSISAIVVLIGLLVFQGESSFLWIGTILLGLSLSCIFPTFFAMAERSFKVTGTITGWFMLGASLGSMGLPWVIGQYFNKVGSHVLPALLLVDLGLLIVLLLVYKSVRERLK